MNAQAAAFANARTRLAGVSKDTPGETAEWQQTADFDERVDFPLLSDTACEASRAFGVYDYDHEMALPAIVLVDGRSGEVVWTYVGESIADRPAAELVLEQAQALHAKQSPAE